MKLEIYDDNVPVANPPVRLRLQPAEHGVDIVVVDTNGKTMDGGHLLTFDNDGTVFRHFVVYGGFGFDLNDHGQIRTT